MFENIFNPSADNPPFKLNVTVLLFEMRLYESYIHVFETLMPFPSISQGQCLLRR